MRNFLAYILILAAAILAIPVALKLFELWPLPLVVAIFLHVVSAAACGLGFWLAERSSKVRSERGALWSLYAFAFSIAMPVFGIIAAIAIFLGQRWRTKRPPSIAADEISVQAPKVFAPDGIRSRQLEILDLLDVEPLIDIFRSGETDLKIGAVKLLGQMRTKRSIVTLMQALLDKDIEVRLFAAGVLGSIEDEYAQGIDKRASALSADPGNAELGMNLANYYLSYAESGLLDDVASKYYYRIALETLSWLPENDRVNFVKTKAHMSLGEYSDALKCITRCIEQNPASGEYEVMYWRILYQMKDYATLRDRIADAENRGIKNTSPEVAGYWMD
jgi:tetratricopeptide (TPR) repeat protein